MRTIRQAILADTPRIAEIHVAGWQQAYRGIVPDEILDTMKPGDRQILWDELVQENYGDLLVAISADRISGFCHLIPSRDNDAGEAHEIAAIYIDPTTWRQGCGRALCEHALVIAREHDVPAVTL